MTSEFSIAAHALVYLYHKDTTLSSEQLAENICTNPARVRKVMAQLKRAGLVATKEGIDGGYLLRGGGQIRRLLLAQRRRGYGVPGGVGHGRHHGRPLRPPGRPLPGGAGAHLHPGSQQPHF